MTIKAINDDKFFIPEPTEGMLSSVSLHKAHKNEEIWNQKKFAKEILEKISIIDPAVCIAGGAPRNWFYNKPARDLDIYLKSYYRTHFEVQKALKYFGFATIEANKEKHEMGYPEGIKFIANFNNEKIPVQFIFLESQVDINYFVERKFDCGPSQIYTNLDGYVYASDLFYLDHKNKSITFRMNDLDNVQLNRLSLRVAKMQRYFPDRKTIFKYDDSYPAGAVAVDSVGPLF